jgi:hypothetical protein
MSDGKFAYVTLLTNEAYIPGALVLAKSLRATGKCLCGAVFWCGLQFWGDRARRVCVQDPVFLCSCRADFDTV